MSILYEKRGRVAYITINRPESRNAIDLETAQELNNAWTDFRDDDNVWIAVITGSGDKSFSAGDDMKSFIPMLTGQSQNREQVTNGGFGGITQGFECWKPIIAAINGHCFAGGFEIMLACDLRLASENASFGQSQARWGIIPGAGGTQRLPRSIPLAKAMEIILMGETITAEEAYRIGLINKVVPLVFYAGFRPLTTKPPTLAKKCCSCSACSSAFQKRVSSSSETVPAAWARCNMP